MLNKVRSLAARFLPLALALVAECGGKASGGVGY